MLGAGKVCVRSRPINAAHYTPVDGVPRLHGHTFRVSLCVLGTIGKDGMVMDFGIVDRFLDKVSEELNFSLLAPRGDRGVIESLARTAPFEIRAVYLPGPATAEVLGLWVCERLEQTLPDLLGKVRAHVIVDEGVGHRAVIECLPKNTQ